MTATGYASMSPSKDMAQRSTSNLSSGPPIHGLVSLESYEIRPKDAHLPSPRAVNHRASPSQTRVKTEDYLDIKDPLQVEYERVGHIRHCLQNVKFVNGIHGNIFLHA